MYMRICVYMYTASHTRHHRCQISLSWLLTEPIGTADGFSRFLHAAHDNDTDNAKNNTETHTCHVTVV